METSTLSGSHHLVALPSPGRGHINPMLNFCRRLALHTPTLNITVIVTEEWLTLLTFSPPLPNVHFRTIPNVIPSEHARGADLKTFLHAVMTKMEGPVEEVLRQEGFGAIDGIIADSLLPWAPKIAGRMGVKVYSFFTQSAAVFLALHRLAEIGADMVSEIALSGEGNECLKYMPKIFTKNADDTSPTEFMLQLVSWYSTSQGLLFSSFNDLESGTFNLLRAKLLVPIYPVGPSIPFKVKEIKSTEPDYLKWLDCQSKNSVLFISLGSFLPIASDQVTEIAIGLQISGVHFLWTVRGETKIIDELSGGKGFVVPWCDQLNVLCHPSVGGFLSHCGWNSTMEAVYAGVPVLTYPLIWDQYPNSMMVVEEWKKGFALKKGTESGGVVGREGIAMGVRKLMNGDCEEGTEVRKRAMELGEICGKALEENGSSSKDINAFVRKLQDSPKTHYYVYH